MTLCLIEGRVRGGRQRKAKEDEEELDREEDSLKIQNTNLQKKKHRKVT